MTYYDTVTLTEDDYGFTSEFRCERDGTAFDLTGFTTFTFSMRIKESGAVKVDKKTMTVISLSAGTLSYVWASGDLNTPGVYETEIEASSTTVTLSFAGPTITVREQVK